MPVALHQKPAHMLAVLPQALFKEFFSEAKNRYYGTGGFAAGVADIAERTLGPLAGRWKGAYFFQPYKKGADFGWGLLAGPVAAVGYFIVPHLTVILLTLPALGELIMGIRSLIKAVACATKHNDSEARLYLRDGLTRIALAPFLALLCVAAIPLELARFFTRALSTLLHAFGCWTFSPSENVHLRDDSRSAANFEPMVVPNSANPAAAASTELPRAGTVPSARGSARVVDEELSARQQRSEPAGSKLVINIR